MDREISDLTRKFDNIVSDKIAGLDRLGTRQEGVDQVKQAKRKFEQLVDVFLTAGDDKIKDETRNKLNKLIQFVSTIETRPRKQVADEQREKSFKKFLNSKQQPWERK